MREFALIDSDAHILEPPALWVDRMPAAYRDRAPRMEHFEQGDAWVIEGALETINFGYNALAGMPGGFAAENLAAWIRWEQVPPGCYEPKARLQAMDEDGVGACVLYPTPRISRAVTWHKADPEFHVAAIRAYNDWLSEFASHAPARLGGIAMLPTTGIAGAMAELRRAQSLPGMRGILLAQWPAGSVAISRTDDAAFAAAQDADIPINIHVTFTTAPVGAKMPVLSNDLRFFDTAIRVKELIDTGVFDRFPKLRVVLVEVDCGWVPFFKEQMDDRFKRLEPRLRPKLKMLPSQYLDRNIFFTFITDSYGVENRRRVGVDQMMWSSDYPHPGTDWPRSWTSIDAQFKGVPENERRKILFQNAARLYKFPIP